MAQVGFTKTLAKEGLKYNILVNVIAPVAASRMTATVMPPDVLRLLNPHWVVPLVAVLVHEENKTESGSIFEVGGGHMAKLRWQRTGGHRFPVKESLSPEDVLKVSQSPVHGTRLSRFSLTKTRFSIRSLISTTAEPTIPTLAKMSLD